MASSNGTVVALTHAPHNLYGYVPDLGACITFIVLFALATVIHAALSVHYRMIWLLPTACLAGLGEVIGWSARLWSSLAPLKRSPYVMQLSVTIMAPSPLVGALFICFERVSERLGSHYGRLPPKWYSRIFLTCDFISLVTQGAGGGLASSANGNRSQLNLGSHIMLGGIAFQLASITVFVALMIEYFIRYANDRPVRNPKAVAEHSTMASARGGMTTRMQLMVLGVCLNTLFLFIRSVYRTVELVDGFDGRIIKTEVYFNVLDGGMVVLAIYTLIFLHPGLLLTSIAEEHSPQMETKQRGDSEEGSRSMLLRPDAAPYRK